MLPRCRPAGEPFVLPTFDVQVSDVEGFLDELQEFPSLFHDCFARSEARGPFLDDMVGQDSPLARPSIEPMALAVEGSRIRSLQRFLSETVWDEEQRRWNSHQLVAEELGEPDGVLMFDESGFVKKGNDSAGVARQYCGTLGKVEHGQVGVCTGYASRQGYALVDQRLFLPDVWFSPAYAPRRRKCQVPDERMFQTKPPLAAERIRNIRQEGILPCRYIVADSV
jgi:SRSO17 transposase